MSDTIAALATGAQVSAIGILRFSGDRAIIIADTLFAPTSGGRLSDKPDRQLVYGKLFDRDGELLDICLATKSRAPHSYTGEDTVELQCHGSPVVLRAALDAAFSLGARQALPGEFTKRAFLNGRMDLTSAEAVADIIDAETAEAAKNAAGQLSGAIARKIDWIYSRLADISTHYHAVLDYPDEDIEDFTLKAYEADIIASITGLKKLSDSFLTGKLMRGGIPATIIGRPNAGKSSLLNALLGYDRAIVTDIPGTTRDTIEERLRLGRLLLRLCDTAGMRETDDEIERLGVLRSKAAMESAELVLAVIDGSCPICGEDAVIIREAEKAPKAIVVLSKSDLGIKAILPETKLAAVSVSAVTGDGLSLLSDRINELFPMPETPAGEILTNARQADAVRRALESLNEALTALRTGATPDIVLTETETAMSALGELTGRSIREDITARIFERFCVGK